MLLMLLLIALGYGLSGLFYPIVAWMAWRLARTATRRRALGTAAWMAGGAALGWLVASSKGSPELAFRITLVHAGASAAFIGRGIAGPLHRMARAMTRGVPVGAARANADADASPAAVEAGRRSRRRLVAVVAILALLQASLAWAAATSPEQHAWFSLFMAVGLLSLPALLVAPLACRVGRRRWGDAGRGLLLAAAGAVLALTLLLQLDPPHGSGHGRSHRGFLDGFSHIVPS